LTDLVLLESAAHNGVFFVGKDTLRVGMVELSCFDALLGLSSCGVQNVIGWMDRIAGVERAHGAAPWAVGIEWAIHFYFIS